MQIAHKIELNPNNKQRTYFAKACGVSRFCYNWALAEWNDVYKKNKGLSKEERVKLSGMILKKKFNSIKEQKYPWVFEVTKYAAQQPFLDLQDGWNRFFKEFKKEKKKPSKQTNQKKKNKRKIGKPVFKKKGKSRDSFYIGGDQIKLKGKKIHIPNLGLVRLKESPRFSGKINSATISRSADRWFVSLQFEISDDLFNQSVKRPEKDRHIGVDVGIEYMAVMSDGYGVKSPMPLKKSLKKLARQQRKLSKKIKVAKKEGRTLKDSKNFQKQKLKVAKIHYRVSCLRKDITHKLTSFLANNYTVIAIEDLNVQGMSKNHRLARSILDVGFYEMKRQITYKAQYRGGSVVNVDRFFPSSKRCFVCKKIKEEMGLSERVYRCECGNVVQRDYNSSMNLKQEIIGRVPAEFTPVEISAMQLAVRPLVVTSIVEAGRKHQKLQG